MRYPDDDLSRLNPIHWIRWYLRHRNMDRETIVVCLASLVISIVAMVITLITWYR